MLTLEPPYYSIKGIIVFRDHASPSTFYYLAGPPRLSKRPDGKPDFMLLKYREALDTAGNVTVAAREQLGGAFLIFGVDCGLSDTLLAEIQGEVSTYAPGADVQLLPVLYTQGSVKVVALDYQPAAGTDPAKATRFVRGVIGTATPSLLQDQRAIFSISLDPDAATLLEASYKDDLSPIGVMYELQFSGLRPALSVHATVDYKRAYEYFKTHLSVGVHTGSGKTATDQTGTSKTTTPPTANPQQPAANPQQPAANPPQPAANSQPPPAITIRISTPGALGAMRFTTKVGTGAESAPVLSSAPAANTPGYQYTVLSTHTHLTFPVGSYVAGSYVLTFTSATDGPVVAQGGVTNPAVTQRTDPPSATPLNPGNPNPGNPNPGNPNPGNPNPGNPNPGNPNPSSSTSSATSNQDQSSTQFGLDIDIQYAMEKLRQEQAITIEIVRQMDGKSIDDMQKEAMDLLRDNILKDFFKPALTDSPAQVVPGPVPTPGPAPAPAAAPGANNSFPTIAAINQPAAANSRPADNTTAGSTTSATASTTKVDIGFQLQYLNQDELRTATFDYSVAAPETKLHAPSGFFSLLLQGTQRDQLIRDIDLDDPFFKVVNAQISTVADWAAIDLKSIVVDAEYGGSGGAPKVRQSYSLLPTDAGPKSFQAYIDGLDMSWRSAIRYTFGTDETVAAQRSSYQMPWVRSTSRALVIAPQNDVPMLHIYVEPGVIDWDLIAHVQTTLSYDDPANGFHAERTFVISSDSKRQTWTVRLSAPELTTYTVRHTWFLKEGRQISGAPYQTQAPQVFVPDPFIDRMVLQVAALVDPASVARVVVAFDYADKPNNFQVHKAVELDGPTFKPVTVTIPLVDARKRAYKYTANIIGASGSQDQRPATESSDLLLNISDGSAVLDVQVTLLGDLAAAHAAAIQVDLQAEPPDGQQPVVQSHLFEVGGDRKWTQRLLLRSDRPGRTFQYRTTVFADGRDPTPSDWIDCETPMLTLLASRVVAGT